jgi:DNA polymerase III subunit beta
VSITENETSVAVAGQTVATGGTVTMPAALFVRAVKAAALAAGKDDTLPTLTGIRLEVDGRQVRFVATDRYRLAVVRWAVESGRDMVGGISTGTTGEWSALIAAGDLMRFAKGIKLDKRTQLPEAVTLTFDGDGLLVATFTTWEGQTSATFRTIDGTFPQWERLFPSETAENGPALWAVGAKYLADACAAAELVADYKNPALRIQTSQASKPAVFHAGHESDGFWLEWLAMPVRLAG